MKRNLVEGKWPQFIVLVLGFHVMAELDVTGEDRRDDTGMGKRLKGLK